MMRFSLFILVLLFSACDRVEELESLNEFDVPFEKNVVKKTYTYIKTPGGDTIRHVYFFDQESGKYEKKIYLNSFITSEQIYKVALGHKALIADYFYEYNEIDPDIVEKLKGEIKMYEDFEVGHRIKGWKAKISFTNKSGLRTTFREEGNAIRDTVLLWGDKPVNSISINYTRSEITVYQYLPFIHLSNAESHSVIYYAEGIGFFKDTFEEDGIAHELNLISIEKMEK